MTEPQVADRQTTNGNKPANSPRKGKPKQWKDMTADPLAEGYDNHQAEYIVGKSPVSWSVVETGQLFSRSKTGRNLHVKLNGGRAINLDTGKPIEIKPTMRNSWQVWLVTSFNSITASKTDF